MVKVKIREATEKDLESILSLFKQPDVDNDEILSIERAKKIFKRIQGYPSIESILPG